MTELTQAQMPTGLTPGYMPGFGNDFETEALPGALPRGRNSPQKCAYGLYGEQLSGTAFTAPSHQNERTWCYRIQPSVKHVGRFARFDLPYWKSAPHVVADVTSLGQYRWDPIPHSAEALTWLTGMRTMTTAGDVYTQVGMASHVYLVTASMVDEYFYSADSELLIVPQEGRLRFCSELGVIDLEPREIAIIPRGLVYRVEVVDGPARGFVCENYGQKFTLPGRGPIGANCMANRRDFKTPVAAFEDRNAPSRVVIKWQGQFHETFIDHSPLDVVAWHGNYAPCKYDLRDYCPIGAILFDHPDPSIFTVLTAPSGVEGTANIDFVLFRERWMTMENTFRPPWYHKNIMSELMGNIYGEYDAKPNGFAPGGISLHNMMIPHGPDNEAFEKATHAELKPHKLDNTMSFMFETKVSPASYGICRKEAPMQDDYIDCWDSLRKHFDGTPEGIGEMSGLVTSWVASANSAQTDFPLNNLPYGVFATADLSPRCGVAIGEMILDVGAVDHGIDPALFAAPSWNAVMAEGPAVWAALRARLTALLSDPAHEAAVAPHLVAQSGASLHLPFVVAEYTDFYASKHHATNVGTMFRGAENALPPNWLSIPIGYNGRASSVVVSGTDVVRPWGQLKGPDHDLPAFLPSRRFDFELELGAIVGTPSNGMVSVAEADQMIFGYVLLNDWSARDIQAWEYQPLGPFQAKATATTISPWIVTKAALEPFRTQTPPRDRPLLPYLREPGPMLYDIALEVALAPEGAAETVIARTNYAQMYYSAAQQLCHHTTSGCAMRTGDLLGSGTISGPTKDSRGALLELSWGGKEPVALETGGTRSFLEDGDRLTLRGAAMGAGYRIGFGECSGTLRPASALPDWAKD